MTCRGSGARNLRRFRFDIVPQFEAELAGSSDKIIPALIGSDDPLYEIVADDVHLVEMDEADAVDAAQNVHLPE